MMDLLRADGAYGLARKTILTVLADGQWHPKTQVGDAVFSAVPPEKLNRLYDKTQPKCENVGTNSADKLRSSAYWMAGSILKEMARRGVLVREVREVPYVGEVVGYVMADARPQLKLFTGKRKRA